MSTDTLTHRDLARLLGVSETTVKSYRAKFPTFLPVARSGKPVRLHPEALEVCRRIRQLFGDGLSIVQTSDALRAEFKEYPLNRRLSTSPQKAAPDTEGAQELRQLVELQRQALDQARQAQEEATRRAEERIAQLEAEVRNLATLEAASKALMADLIAELRGARPARSQEPAPEPQPAPPPTSATSAAQPTKPTKTGETVLTARRIVTVHGREGAASYTLDREPRPEPPLPDAPRPAPEFLELPAVIRSERGEFLGLPGKQSVQRLVQALSHAGMPEATWVDETPQNGPATWTCLLPLDQTRTRELTFEQATTPRGNRVGLVRAMRTGFAQASTQDIQDLFRQVRDSLG